ncbi:MAG: type II secretion system F family protein [Clostridia bacterium]
MIKDYTKYELTGREKRIFYFAGYGSVFFVVYLFYHSILLSAVSGCLVYFLQPLVERQLAERRMNLLTVQFKDLLYSLSASVAAGRQMGEALVEAEQNLAVMYEAKEPIMKELCYMRINLVENKESDKVLLKDLATRSKNEDINNFVQVYATCRSMGGDLEKIIGHTSEILSDKMAIEREIKVITAQKKTEGRIISMMPLAMLLMMNVFSYSYIEPLYRTAGGRIIMTGALVGVAYGMYLMEKLSEIEV